MVAHGLNVVASGVHCRLRCVGETSTPRRWGPPVRVRSPSDCHADPGGVGKALPQYMHRIERWKAGERDSSCVGLQGL